MNQIRCLSGLISGRSRTVSANNGSAIAKRKCTNSRIGALPALIRELLALFALLETTPTTGHWPLFVLLGGRRPQQREQQSPTDERHEPNRLEPMGRGRLRGNTMHDQQPSSQELAIRLVISMLDLFDTPPDRTQLEAVAGEMTGAGAAMIASVAVDLAQRVITQTPTDPDVLRESLRAELARLADDDGARHG